MSSIGAKITPTFPIILAGQGGTSLAKLFTMPNTGGVEWIVLPSRKYSKSSYNEATLTSDINKALATGVQTVLFSTTVNSFSTKLSQNTISLSSPIEGNAMVKMLSLNGQTIYNWQGFLTKGSNVINLNTTLPQSFYIINVQKNDQTLYSSKLILK